jgi:hypothetical protein
MNSFKKFGAMCALTRTGFTFNTFFSRIFYFFAYLQVNFLEFCHVIFTIFFHLFSGDQQGSSTFLNFVKGDLILLDEDTSGEAVLTSGWCTGTCERNEERGDFPAEAVYVLPCLSRPPDDILVSQKLKN